MKSEDTIPQISLHSLASYIKGTFDASDEAYSILKYARRSSSEIGEIVSAVETKYVADLITLSPRRLAFYETIVAIETEIKLRSVDDLSPIFHKIYGDYVVPLLKSIDSFSNKKLEDKILDETEQEISTHLNLAFNAFKASQADDTKKRSSMYKPILRENDQKIFDEIKKVYDEVSSRIEKGLYMPGELSFTDDHDSIVKKIVFDRLYNRALPVKIKKLIQPLILDILESQSICYPADIGHAKPLERIPVHRGVDRHTFMMIGAPASGKSTSYAMLMMDARLLGIDRSDLVKSNTDAYRYLVSNESELGIDKIHHAAGNYDESYLITKRVYNRLKEKIQSAEGAPHILIDSVYPTQEKINLGIMNEGNLHLNCISIPAELSINRALSRGRATGRYIDTSLLLKSHRDISMNFHQILIENKDSNIEFVLLNNNVSLGELPILIEEGNLKTKVIKIHDGVKLEEFLNKANLNLTSETKDSLYFPAKQTKSIVEHVNKLSRLGFDVKFIEEPTKSTLRMALERRESSAKIPKVINIVRKKNKISIALNN